MQEMGEHEVQIEQQDALIGVTVENLYSVESVVGRGGMGVVYVARHLKLDKQIALKFLHPRLSRKGKALNRFTQEARLMAQVRSPNTVEVFSFGITEYGAYIAEEWVDGAPLSQVIAGTPLPRERALRIFRDICNGVKAAHDEGIIHRDLKPENVLLANIEGVEIAKVTDFGIATLRTHEQTTRLTETGEVIGTLSYMAPEQLCGQDADERSDIFSLGCILFEMLTGEQLINFDSPADIFKNSGTDRVQSCATLLPSDAALLMKLVDPKPALRFSSIAEVLAAIDAPPDTVPLVKTVVNKSAFQIPVRSGAFRASLFFCGFILVGAAAFFAISLTSSPISRFKHDLQTLAPYATLKVDYQALAKDSSEGATDGYEKFLSAVEKKYGRYSAELIDAHITCLRQKPKERHYLTNLSKCADATLWVNAAAKPELADKIAKEVSAVLRPLDERHDESIRFATAVAQYRFETGDEQSAKELFSQVLKYGAHNPLGGEGPADDLWGERLRANLFLGIIARHAGDYEKAIEYHSRALILPSVQVQGARGCLGFDYYKNGDDAKAKSEFGQWLHDLRTDTLRFDNHFFDQYFFGMIDYGDYWKEHGQSAAAADAYRRAYHIVQDALMADGRPATRARGIFCMRVVCSRLADLGYKNDADPIKRQTDFTTQRLLDRANNI